MVAAATYALLGSDSRHEEYKGSSGMGVGDWKLLWMWQKWIQAMTSRERRMEREETEIGEKFNMSKPVL